MRIWSIHTRKPGRTSHRFWTSLRGRRLPASPHSRSKGIDLGVTTDEIVAMIREGGKCAG